MEFQRQGRSLMGQLLRAECKEIMYNHKVCLGEVNTVFIGRVKKGKLKKY